MERVLKIDLLFWNEIWNGSKKYEVRKVNKQHIKVDDIIYFVSLDELNLYGKAKVIRKNWFPIEDFKKVLGIDKMTMDFVYENYQNEEELMVFELEVIKESE